MQTLGIYIPSSVTYRFLDIKKIDKSTPTLSPAEYINKKEYYGTLDTPILDVCEVMYDDMNVKFDHRLFVFKDTQYVRDEQTPRNRNISSGEIVYIYVMLMSSTKKLAFTNTVFNCMCMELNRIWDTLGYECDFEWQTPVVTGSEHDVAYQEGLRRAHMHAKERNDQDWNEEESCSIYT